MFDIISKEFEVDIIQILLLSLPLAYVVYNLYQSEFHQTDRNYEPDNIRLLTKVISVSCSITITTIWASELEGTQKNEFGDILLLIYWVATLRVLLDKGKPRKSIMIIVMSTLSLASQLYVELYTAWIPIAIFTVLIVMTMMERMNYSISNTLLITLSSQVSVIYYFSRLDCIVGYEFLMESMSALSSLIATVFLVYIKKDTRTASAFYACMIFISLTIVEHYESCLEEGDSQWVTLVFVVIYVHMAVFAGLSVKLESDSSTKAADHQYQEVVERPINQIEYPDVNQLEYPDVVKQANGGTF